MQMSINSALIGYKWPEPPRVVYSLDFPVRQRMWQDGYSVDVVPIAVAAEIEKLIGPVSK